MLEREQVPCLRYVALRAARYCTEPFVAEPVEVVYESDYPGNTFIKPGDKKVYPMLEPREPWACVRKC